MPPRRDLVALQTRRMQAAQWFQRGRSQAQIARRFQVSRPTAHRWCQAWRRKGRAGRKPRLSSENLRRLETALLQGPTALGFRTHLWTLERIAEVVWKTCQVRYSVSQVWRLLRQLGWSRQRPDRHARERNQAAIRRGVRGRLPQVKKPPRA